MTATPQLNEWRLKLPGPQPSAAGREAVVQRGFGVYSTYGS
jgi:hypothetical protein